ncbi:hypothetical protein SISNIDRAFT_105939 [Sistotremastrum niveocremeum HHB9708]|uniref:26S proteasome complex subunit SEM1 n=1 Tax=Sistotremastrum niveocremeum HHB9708 TaxID=1314777 RepID=A0A164TVK0_9AGAM|nr:hypothetical protein SISNIDRAFT_105939 [Sistotremastrum niveocremeum HHB9708]
MATDPKKTTEKSVDSEKAGEKKDDEKPAQSKTTLQGALEEDDEFEEFPVQDWDDSSTELAHLKGGVPGGAKADGDKLWEDNWDDDDVEEEFSLQLRNELEKNSAVKRGAEPMEH